MAMRSADRDAAGPAPTTGASHLAELVDGEIHVLQRLGALVGILLQQQLGELETSEGDLRAEADLV